MILNLNELEHRWVASDTNKVWFTSDTHFYHNNIISYCNRPYKSVKEMNEALINNWNSVVGKTDIVWHLGDIALGMKSCFQEVVPKLNGTIFLVRGNHDRTSNSFCQDNGISEVFRNPVILNDRFILSHRPLFITMEDKLKKHNLVNLYGHMHDNPDYLTWDKYSACLCVERHNYKPISFTEILNHFE